MASSLSLIILAGLVGFLCYLQVQIVKFSKDIKKKIYCDILLILFVACNFWYYYNVDIRFPLDLILIIGYCSFIGVFSVYNLVDNRVLHRQQVIRNIDHDFQSKKSHLHEYLRKFFHFFLFGGTFLFLIIYNAIMIEILKIEPEFGADVKHPLWESLPILRELNIDFVYDSDLYFPHPLEFLIMTFYTIVMPFVIILEYFRLNPKKGIPMRKLFVKSLRTSEQENVGDYYFFMFGLFISTIFLPITCMFGVFCVLCFGDSFASFFGKKIGKHKIKWEPEKSWEGSFAGFFFTFITSIFFVGLTLAIVLGIIFVAIDIVTPEKIKISDNFLYPLICTLILLIVIYGFGFQIDAIIANYFQEANTYYIERIPELKY